MAARTASSLAPFADAASAARHAAASIAPSGSGASASRSVSKRRDRVGAAVRVRLGEHAHEAGARGVVEGHDERVRGLGADRQRALEAVEDAPLDVLAHERVQAELALEVVVERSRGRVGGAREVGDRDRGVAVAAERVQRREHQAALR